MSEQSKEMERKPVKVTAFYREFYRRGNLIQQLIYDFFNTISSSPRLLMEVFIRRSLGERYFSTEQCGFLSLVLLVGPYLYFRSRYGMDFWDTLKGNWAWYAFSIAFAYMCFVRWKEIRREPSVFELGKFSLSSGIWLPFFDNIKPFGKHLTPRQIAIYAEPLLFFAAGIIFYLMHQTLGFLLLFVSIVYSISYMASYKHGDNFLMDKLDKIICNESLYDTLVMGKGPAETKGFNPTMSGPSLFETREQLYNSFMDDDEEEAGTAA